jgi:cytoskeletal protein CcmA (bactofilin family)
VDDDLYLAGAQIDLYAEVTGDAVIAAGEMNLEGKIGGDLMAAGGSIELRGSVTDDVRLAGGQLRLLGQTGDDLVAAGGRIQLAPGAVVNGGAWITGGDIRIDGTVKDGLTISGGRVVLAGTINGDVELYAEQVLIESSTVITGNLLYQSPHQATIQHGASIAGKVAYTPIELSMKPLLASAIFAALALLLSLIVAAVVLYLLFPTDTMAVSQSLSSRPWQSLGVGLAVFAATPVLIAILFSTLIGSLLALILLALYLVMLLAGYFVGALALANMSLNRIDKSNVSNSGRALTLGLTIFVLAVINLLPMLGSLVNWAVLLAGVGALGTQLYHAKATGNDMRR